VQLCAREHASTNRAARNMPPALPSEAFPGMTALQLSAWCAHWRSSGKLVDM